MGSGTAEIINATQYDYDKCEYLQREAGLSYDGVCNGRGKDFSDICNENCPHFIGNQHPKAAEESTPEENLENEIFSKIYSRKGSYTLEEGVEMLKRVVKRIEDIRKERAKDSLNSFLINYCSDERCSKCSFASFNSDCLVKIQLAEMERNNK